MRIVRMVCAELNVVRALRLSRGMSHLQLVTYKLLIGFVIGVQMRSLKTLAHGVCVTR
jgi:hypothetical protein